MGVCLKEYSIYDQTFVPYLWPDISTEYYEFKLIQSLKVFFLENLSKQSVKAGVPRAWVVFHADSIAHLTCCERLDYLYQAASVEVETGRDQSWPAPLHQPLGVAVATTTSQFDLSID